MLLGAASAPAGGGKLPPGAQVVLAHSDEWAGDSRVGTYVSSTWGFSTTTYWIEGPTGLVLIDTQFLPSATAEALAWAESVTGTKVKLAVVLHANPDKFNGTATLKKRGIRVVTSAQVRALIPAVHEKRLKAFYDRYQPDYPKEFTLPESFGDHTTELQAGGVTLKAHVLGPGCSEAHVAVEFAGHLFVGDLVGSGAHSWLEIGRTDEWLKRLGELKALKPEFVHPGRGPSGDERLLSQEENYLQFVIAAVAAEKPSPAMEGTGQVEAALARVRAKIDERFFGYRFAVFLDIGLPAEWRRQAQAARPLPPSPGK
jgi:glyoxylase-like metal-dependent hydrolase (beta-lactamase superfamily II)